MSQPYHITLGVTGCIGAYKAVLVLRALQQAGAEVEVVMTRHACEFIQPLTFQALSGRPVITDMWNRTEDREIKHIALAQGTDMLVVAPATANSLARFAHGLADDFLSTLYVSATVPVLVAPAMNVEMWHHPATQENCRRLRERGVHILEPEAGYLACGMVGEGRLASPEFIAEHALKILLEQKTRQDDLKGEHVLVTAGPTVEDIDPVRFLTNRSSGRMGYALAESAQARGAKVTLISGPTNIPSPAGVTLISVRSTREMYDATLQALEAATVIIKAAAVCDFRPVNQSERKIKKQGGREWRFSLELEPTEDILAEVSRRKGNRIVVGFAAETDHVLTHAQEKLQRKNLDFLVVNDVTQPGVGFDVSTNQVTILCANGDQQGLPLLSKREIADRILDIVLKNKLSKTLQF